MDVAIYSVCLEIVDDKTKTTFSLQPELWPVDGLDLVFLNEIKTLC